MSSGLPKVSEVLAGQIDRFAFEMPPQVQAGLDFARALGLPVEIPDLRAIQDEAKEQILQSVDEIQAKVTGELPGDVLSAIEWLL